MIDMTVLGEIDGPVDGYKTVIVRASASANEHVPRHTHPGVESTYIIEGEETLSVDGQPDRMCRAGDIFQIPPDTPHSVRIGPAGATMVGNYMVRKGEPLATDL